MKNLPIECLNRDVWTGGVWTAGVSTAGVWTAGVWTDGVSTAGVWTDGVSTAGVLTGLRAIARYAIFHFAMQFLQAAHINVDIIT